jgi:cytidine deaminase
MEIKKITLSVEEYSAVEELRPEDRDLLERAITASRSSYSPYSSFRVGAAVRLANGVIFTGNNQENAAYPSGLCAERVALFAAQSQHPDSAVKAIAIYAHPEDFSLKDPVTPCGACRQVMAEYEYRHHVPSRIIMGNGNGRVQIVEGAETLLPLVFYLEELKKHR